MMKKSEIKILAEALNIELPKKFTMYDFENILEVKNLVIGLDNMNGDWVIVKRGTQEVVARCA
jgi:hypothetical protein